jgi:putative membrane-bound dehydrogenase-like protein
VNVRIHRPTFVLAFLLTCLTVGAQWPAAVPPTPPAVHQAIPLADAIGAVELADPTLTLELVAAEPIVQSPVAMTFDEHGRLFVVEMIDYPHDSATHPGRISVLEDSDGDGRFDRAHVFADDLPWPSGAFPWDGGLFVTASPDILYLKDTTGDGRADLRRVVYTGFGNTVPEPMPDMVVNGFAWGLDNRIYGATSRNGGQVQAPGDRRIFDLRTRDFSIDPRTLQLRPESGGGQFGVTFDDYGRRFVSSNANHLLMVMYEDRYTARNGLVEYPRPVLDIPEDGPSARVFRISPDEEWRVLRTQWRASGKVRGLVEHGGLAGGYFTSACSLFVYRGDALPSAYYGSAFVAEPANNLAHRKVLEPDGVPFRGVRPPAEAGTEFLRSASTWFRPVNFATGPDGALYVVDMHRAVVEDPKTIPPGIVQAIDVRAGSTHGRIYRIVPKGFTTPTRPNLANADGPSLAGALSHTNGWVRDTAARLLYQRQDGSAVPVLEQMAATATSGATRAQALHTLHGLRRLAPRHLVIALEDPDSGVREQAVRLAEAFGDNEDLVQAVLSRAGDQSARVRYQLAFTLGNLPFTDHVHAAFQTLLDRDGDDVWMRTALATSLSHPVRPILERMTLTEGWSERVGHVAFAGQVLRTIGARGQRAELDAALTVITDIDDDAFRLRLARDFVGGLARGDVAMVRADPDGRLAPITAAAERVAADPDAGTADRVAALQLLAQDPRTDSTLYLTRVQPTEPQDLQLAALAALRARDGHEVASALVERWETLTPRVRQDVIALLVARPERARTLLDAVESGQIARSSLSAGQAQALLTHADADVASRAAHVLERVAADREQVVERYRPALALEGDATRGRAVFAEACAACHRLDDQGVDLGPNLLGTLRHGKEGLLIAILDPNRQVDPAYLMYEVETRDGDTIVGAITSESPSSLTITPAFGHARDIARHQVVRMRSAGTSLMPEGLESAISPPQMADLLEYLTAR